MLPLRVLSDFSRKIIDLDRVDVFDCAPSIADCLVDLFEALFIVGSVPFKLFRWRDLLVGEFSVQDATLPLVWTHSLFKGVFESHLFWLPSLVP